MTSGRQESTRGELLSLRRRQKQLGRGLRLIYEQVLREPVPDDMIEALLTAERSEAMGSQLSSGFPAAR
jgi:hypothetical protein